MEFCPFLSTRYASYVRHLDYCLQPLHDCVLTKFARGRIQNGAQYNGLTCVQKIVGKNKYLHTRKSPDYYSSTVSFVMTTGDLKNNLRKLVSELKQIHYPQSELDIKGVAQGIPKAFLPIVHHVFLDYSISLAQHFASKEYELYGKTDLRFMEAVYKVLRDEFGYKPQLTREQFLTIGFAERKIIVLCEMVKLLREKHDELTSKGGKSEKKKAKQTWPSSQLRGDDNGTTKECSDKVMSTHSDRFPGPLPKDIDMKSFRSNEEAMKAGLGLKEPLITRMFLDGEPSICTGSHVMPSNSGPSGKAGSSVNDLVPSNLVIKSSGDQKLLGIKFPVSQNSEIRSNLSRQCHVKTVTWEDQLSEPQVILSEQGEKGSVAHPLYNGAMNPISVPATVHSIPFAKTSPAYFPLQSENMSSAGVIPYAIPSPVSMTAVPLPSADLMLTPTAKNTHHQTIPLSISHNENDLQDTSFSDGKFPCTRVVRHSSLIEPSDVLVTDSSSSAEAQVYVLKQQVQELQEKFDSMVLLNNELSARVVLLESKMKLVEEASGNKSCCNCGSPLPRVDKKNESQPDKIVVSGFNVQSEKNPGKESFENSLKCISTKINEETGNDYAKGPKSVLKNNSTSRKLFTKTATSLGSDQAVKDISSCHVSPPYSEKSDGDDDDSDGTGKSKSASSSEQDASIVISPFPSVSKLSRVFANSSTKNAVVNVHKRLQETRELLTRTNRDFATKFNHYQVE